MASLAPSGKSWKEHNKFHKEQKKKWREEKLIKKAKIEEAQVVVKNEKIEEENKQNILKVSTMSIAIPGSIMDNAQSPELRSYLAGQIARAAVIYNIDEIIVYDDQGDLTDDEKKKIKKDAVHGEQRRCCLQLARILQYLECPQYLRKYFFPKHDDLQYAGLINPLAAPHHLKQQDESLYREGVVTNKPIKSGHGSQVNVGLLNDVHIDKTLQPGWRVTVKIPPEQNSTKRLKGTVVSPKLPRLESGIYWGYTVRLASNLSQIFSSCPYENGYDLSIGTSDKGKSVKSVPEKSLKYTHGLIVFGGLNGIEAALENDPKLVVDDPSLVFDQYLNTRSNQGSKTIRTEEALLISLEALDSKFNPIYPPLPAPQFPSESSNNNNSNDNDKKQQQKNSIDNNLQDEINIKKRVYNSDSSDDDDAKDDDDDEDDDK
ncbi:putative methyltransferase C9orf114 homolog, partial [Aphidius gifuensis]|uniref:putative methyltransferase C9orf114 homolog n=1 Tax=Aphidius gifuensis TaxID=684658 RepID=UPI001CDB68B8